MSYGVMPFAVNVAALRGWIGSGDEALLARLLQGWAGRFAEIDRLDDPDEPGPPAADALRHLIMGEAYDPGVGFKYAYLLKQLAGECGDPLPNLYWAGANASWVGDEFDPALAAAGVPADTFGAASHLLYRGSPIRVPTPADYPFMGHLLPDEVPAVAAALAGIDPRQFEPVNGDNEFRELRDWLEACRSTGRGLMTFYH